MKQTITVRNGYPLYAIALVALIGAFGFHVHTVFGWLVTALVAAAAWFVAHRLMPDEIVEVEIPEDPADPEIAALQQERDRAVSEMRRINETIPDEKITAQIDHIESTTAKIFQCVLEHPERKGQIRRFMEYYLPTTIRLLSEYERMEKLGVSGTNIDASKQRIEEMLDTVCSGYDKQLDALYANAAMDISAETTVLQSMMKQEGLLGSDF